jgi:lipopolysaccharide/colanic/teichoic acid biosynthesis glycosyltransferase
MSHSAGLAHSGRETEQSGLSPGRILDLAVAIAAIVVLGPIMVLIALAVLIESGRPIFYSQTRLGLKGRHFRIYKFRKFYHTCGADGLPLTMKNDSRMTRLGRILARTKLDELPQFWNVLRGDMSMVGPRPESIDFADCFTAPYRGVLDYKPGIFGPSQVMHRNESSRFPAGADPTEFYREVLFAEKALSDLSYYPERTVWSDLGWIARGVLAVVGWRMLPPELGDKEWAREPDNAAVSQS